MRLLELGIETSETPLEIEGRMLFVDDTPWFLRNSIYCEFDCGWFALELALLRSYFELRQSMKHHSGQSLRHT